MTRKFHRVYPRSRFNAELRTLRGNKCAECGKKLRFKRMIDRNGRIIRIPNLEFHHLDPSTKLYEVTAAPTRRAALIELAKCVLLCTACHDGYHASEEFFHAPSNDDAILRPANDDGCDDNGVPY